MNIFYNWPLLSYFISFQPTIVTILRDGLGTPYIATFIDCILELQKSIFRCSVEDSISMQSTYVHSVDFFLEKHGKPSIFNKNSNFQVELQKNKNKIT